MSTEKPPERRRPEGKPAPPAIADTPENIARAIMAGPPKRDWRYLDRKDSKGSRAC